MDGAPALTLLNSHVHRFFRRFGTVFDVQRSAVSIAAGGIVPRARVPEVGFAHCE